MSPIFVAAPAILDLRFSFTQDDFVEANSNLTTSKLHRIGDFRHGQLQLPFRRRGTQPAAPRDYRRAAGIRRILAGDCLFSCYSFCLLGAKQLTSVLPTD